MRLLVPALAGVLLLSASRVVGADPVAEDPFALVRESEMVTGTAKRSQPLSETPSAVTVVTASEIQTHGYRTLAEALRWVRGLYVTNDRNYEYLGVRGLQRPGDYTNKVLVAIDGHTVNGSIFGDAAIGTDFGLDLELVERIEIVRGPGSSLYGASAVLAIINVVTRRPSSRPGALASGRAGDAWDHRAHLSLAASEPGRPEWMISGSWLRSPGTALSYRTPDDPASMVQVPRGSDREQAYALFAKARWGGFGAVAKLSQREKHIPTGSFATAITDPRNRTLDATDFVELTAERAYARSLTLNGRAWWSGSRYRGYYVYGTGDEAVINVDDALGDQLGTEWRADWSLIPGHVATAGAEVQALARARLINYDEAPRLVYFDGHPGGGLAAVYVKDEQRIRRSGVATYGLRVDRYSRLAPVLSPRVDLVWHSSSATTWKFLGGSAFRAPTLYEQEYASIGYLAAGDLRPERVKSFEGTVERRAGPAQLLLSAYRNDVRDLIDQVVANEAGDLQYRNVWSVRSLGVEGQAEMVWPQGTRARVAVAWQESRGRPGGELLTNSPRWNGHVVVSHAPPTGRFTAGVGARYLSTRLTLAGLRTAAAFVTDARVAFRSRRIEYALDVRNLFDARYGDPVSSEFFQDQILQDPRHWYLSVSLRNGRHP